MDRVLTVRAADVLGLGRVEGSIEPSAPLTEGRATMMTSSSPVIGQARILRSERFLAAVAPFDQVVLVSHVNPDPDALASMMGLRALLSARQPGKPVVITYDGLIARAENQAMVRLLPIEVVPVESVPITPATAVVMVDSQPNTGRHGCQIDCPTVVLDHHDTPGTLEGVKFSDIRPDLGATCTMVTGYLIEQGLSVSPRLATALLYGIETEISGFPREAGPLDDGALVWLFPRSDKDLLARIRNPRLPQSYFATFQYALTNAFLYRDVIVAWCGPVPQPDIIAELADFFVRFDQVSWALTMGLYDNLLKLSVRTDHIGGHCGETLREVLSELGTAGGHDKRAGGAIRLESTETYDVDLIRAEVRGRFLAHLGIDEECGHRLVEPTPPLPAP